MDTGKFGIHPFLNLQMKKGILNIFLILAVIIEAGCFHQRKAVTTIKTDGFYIYHYYSTMNRLELGNYLKLYDDKKAIFSKCIIDDTLNLKNFTVIFDRAKPENEKNLIPYRILNDSIFFEFQRTSYVGKIHKDYIIIKAEGGEDFTPEDMTEEKKFIFHPLK